MPDAATALQFFAAALLLALAPGPDIIFVLTLSAAEGRRSGLAVAAGLLAGVMVHTLAVALGLAAVFAASPAAFTVLRAAGAAYLLYLAWGAWRAGALLTAGSADEAPQRVPWPRLMLRGLVMNLTNPKVVLFFLALLPQFVRPGRGPVAAQIVVLGLEFALAAGIVFSIVALAAGALRERLAGSARVQRWLNRAAALVFVALAASLLLQH
ncbi:MAG: LysE family translocator [Ottowia sp.]|nr:LysE family translocator [Ottowia sp.]